MNRNNIHGRVFSSYDNTDSSFVEGVDTGLTHISYFEDDDDGYGDGVDDDERSTRMQKLFFLNHLNPVMVVFIG